MHGKVWRRGKRGADYDSGQRRKGSGSRTGAEGSIIIEKVRRWEPNDAYLYTVRIEYEEDQYEFVRGEHPWNSADFATIQGVMSASAEMSV